MKVEVLVSTMFKEDYSLIKEMNLKTDSIIINQTNYDGIEIIEREGRVNKLIHCKERGLSKSRNLALKNMKADICLIADDDIRYNENYEQKIIKMFEENPKSDIICFCANAPNRHKKKYFKKKRKLGFITTMKVTSFEIAFKRESIKENGIYFDENFGTGSSKYKMGEENIFLYDCLKKGLEITYIPEYILEVVDEESTWFEGFSDKYFFDKGAIYKRMSSKAYIILILQFALRRYKLYKNENRMFNAIKMMLKGAKDYDELMKGY